MSAPEHSPRRVEERLAARGGAIELLRAPAALFGALVRLRGRLYDRRWLPVRSVDTPVVSVGNLTAGGTGKTPFVAWLVRRLAARGVRAGILSRGYRPRGADGAGPNDEARMLAALLPGVPHVEDRDRPRGAAALEAQGVDVIVLDDGFQHRRLARDVDVVLVDATRPFGLGPPPGAPGAEPVRALLPRGLLREPPGALTRAHALVVTRSDALSDDGLAGLEAELAALAPRALLARAVHRPARLRVLAPDGAGADASRPLAWLAGRTVDLVSGIGNPAAFEATVRGLGATVAVHRRFPDHHAFGPADLAGLGARPVVTTAKDGARLADPGALGGAGWAPDVPRDAGREPGAGELLVLDVELEVVRGAEGLDRLLDALPESPARRARAALHGGLHG